MYLFSWGCFYLIDYLLLGCDQECLNGVELEFIYQI